jgi:hypothetical protein
MGDIAQRGNRLTAAKGGRAGFQKGRRVGHKRTGNTQRENRLEELGRVDAEKAWTRHGKRDLRLEKHRIRSELKKGGKPWGTGPKPGSHEFLMQNLHKRKGKAVGGVARGARKAADTFIEKVGGSAEGKPHSTKEGRIASGKRKITRFLGRHADKYKNPKRKFPPEKPKWSDMPRKPLENGKMQPLKKGGKSDKNWIQKAVNPKHKGYCTPMTKKTCTPARKALARTFKKKAKTGW